MHGFIFFHDPVWYARPSQQRPSPVNYLSTARSKRPSANEPSAELGLALILAVALVINIALIIHYVG